MDHIRAYLLSKSLSIIGITETWLSSSVNNSELVFPGYNIYRVDRNYNKGGGLLFLVKDSWPANIENSYCSNDYELLHISIDFSNCKPLQIVLVYRSPSSNLNAFIDGMQLFLNNVNYKSLPFIIMGDLNHDLLKCNVRKDSLIQTLKTYGITPSHKIPTRVTASSSSSIDWVLCNGVAEEKANDFNAVDVGFSDHRLLTFKYKKTRNKKSKHIYKLKHVYNPSSIKKFQNFLSNNIDFIFTDLDMFVAYVKNAHDKFFHTRKFRDIEKTQFDYLSFRYKETAKARDDMIRDFRSTGNYVFYKKFRVLRRKANNIARNDKKNFFTSEIQKYKNSDPKKMWKLINIFFKKDKHNFPSCFLDEGIKIESNDAIANGFNLYFSSIVPEILRQAYGSADQKLTISFESITETTLGDKFHFSPVSPIDVLDTYTKCKKSSVDKSFFPSGLFFMDTAFFGFNLCSIINYSLKTSIFPSSLKTAKVLPIYKNGEKRLFKNYRPISILSSLSKLFEKIAAKQILKFINLQNLLSPSQFGFEAGNSTESTLLYVLEKVYNAIDKNNICAVAFLDYSKAFDSICHTKLCEKLITEFNFSIDAAKWVYSYLTDRSQYVVFNDKKSSNLPIYYGVPQGSILGPLLFKLYINNINDCLSYSDSSLTLYADDTALVVVGKSPNDLISKMNKELNLLHTYCSNNKLVLNHDKTKLMLFNTKCSMDFINCFNISGKPIEIVEAFKYLGYTIDSNLNFKSHVLNIDKKLASCNTILARASNFLSVSSLKLIFNSIGLSYILYSKSILITLSEFSTRSLERKLVNAGAIIHNCLCKHVSDNSYCLSFILNYYYYIFLFKIRNNLFSPQLSKLFLQKPHHYSTRGCNDVYLSTCRLVRTKNKFSFFAALKWNNLPNRLSKVDSVRKFAQSLNNYLENG